MQFPLRHLLLTLILSAGGAYVSGCAMINGITGEQQAEKKDDTAQNDDAGTVQGQVAVSENSGFGDGNDVSDATNLWGVPDARVRAISGDGSFIDVTTDTDGNFRISLPNGNYNLIAERVNSDTGQSYNARQSVDVTNGEDQTLDEPLTIVESGAIVGVVYLEGRAPGSLTGAVVSVGGAGIFALTDEYGSYGFPNVPEGTYDIVVRKFGYAAKTIADVEVLSGVFTFAEDISLAAAPEIVPAGYGLVAGTVRDLVSGETIAGALVSVRALGVPAVSDGDGAFELALPEGEFTLYAVADGYDLDEQTVTVDTSTTATLEFSLAHAPTFGQGSIEGTIVHGTNGQPLASAVILSNPSRGQTFSDNTGHFALNLPVGCYTIASARGGFEQTKRGICIDAGLDLDLGNIALYPTGPESSQCIASHEICNGEDDDCDGEIDDGVCN